MKSHSPPRPRRLLHVSVEQLKTKKQESKRWLEGCQSERASVTLRWDDFLSSFFSFEEWFWRRFLILRALFWLVGVVRNRKRVAVTDAMMTQRLFFSFCTFWGVFFSCFRWAVLTRRATSTRLIVFNCWRHGDDVAFLLKLYLNDAGSYRFKPSLCSCLSN